MPESHDGRPAPLELSRRLDSWKEIAVYLNRTVRTVQRWERELGLPVHRVKRQKLPAVFAYAHELDAWWQERRVEVEADESLEQQPASPAPVDQAPGVKQSAVVDAGLVRTRRVGRTMAMTGVAMLLGMAAIPLWGTYRAAESRRQAEALYTQGRAAWNQRTPAGFRQAIEQFEQAIALDPQNARAYAGLADSHALLEAFGVEPAAEALPQALAAAERAVALAPGLGEAHTSLAFVLWEMNDREAALRRIEQAIVLDPNYATARHWYALFLQDAGRYADAVREGTLARSLNPASAVIGSDLAIMLRNAGEPDLARALLEELVVENPTFPGHRHELAEAYRLAGRFDLALEQMSYAVKLGDARGTTLARLAWLQARNGVPKEAASTARRLRTMHEQGKHVPQHAMVEALTASGDFDSAFRLLAEGIRTEAAWVSTVWARSDVYGDLMADRRWKTHAPGIEAIVARVRKDSEHTRPYRATPSPIPTPALPAR